MDENNHQDLSITGGGCASIYNYLYLFTCGPPYVTHSLTRVLLDDLLAPFSVVLRLRGRAFRCADLSKWHRIATLSHGIAWPLLALGMRKGGRTIHD